MGGGMSPMGGGMSPMGGGMSPMGGGMPLMGGGMLPVGGGIRAGDGDGAAWPMGPVLLGHTSGTILEVEKLQASGNPTAFAVRYKILSLF